jgi:aminoglycoside phosphotransferase (APT) family kinase protein
VTVRLHADQVDVDVSVARRLVAEQFPRWAGLPVRPVRSGGTDNAVFRLGGRLALRMPVRASAVSGVRKEVRWLPLIAAHVTLDVPAVLADGAPGAGYPFPWTVVRWLAGQDALTAPPTSPADTAAALGRFVAELQAIDTAAAPAPGSEGFVRGGPLAGRDRAFRAALAQCDGLVDVERVAAVWDEALRAPDWPGRPVWLHADLLPGNLLVRDGRLAGVLDFGAICTGDPAYDVTAAWHVLDADSRPAFLDLVGADRPAVLPAHQPGHDRHRPHRHPGRAHRHHLSPATIGRWSPGIIGRPGPRWCGEVSRPPRWDGSAAR